MESRIKRLEEQVNSALVYIAQLEEENAVLKKQAAAFASERVKLIKNNAGAKELTEFKSKLKKRLSKIVARIEKATSSQDLLFNIDTESEE